MKTENHPHVSRLHLLDKALIAIALLVVATLAACSDDSASVVDPDSPVQPAKTGYPISFGTADGTRAFNGTIDDVARLHLAGFGVFAYYTGNSDYQPGTLLPNFFYNQSITWNADSLKWTYTPQRFWPNEVGEPTGGTERHRISFFAYAPYEPNNLDMGTLPDGSRQTADTVGIIGISSNLQTAAPYITYRSAVDSVQQSVDLMWGVASDASNYTNAVGDSITFTAGRPLYNMTRPKDGTPVRFRFTHALSQIGIAVTDRNIHMPINPDSGTLVLVKSVTLTGNVARGGQLSLNNTTASQPSWSNLVYGNGKDSTTIIADGRSITRSLRDVDYGTAKGTDLWIHNCAVGGVNSLTRYLLKSFNNDEEAGVTEPSYFMVIPAEDVVFNVKVDYTVQTFNGDDYTRIEHTVTRRWNVGSLSAGQTYTINIILED